ncbi:MAG: radical SAM protein [Deltaproteobacteria bacterium]|nr:radical SAM protein [Deltaproteobacteria bacterium]
MGFEQMRRRLPIVASLPRSGTRWARPLAPGERPTPKLAVWEFTLACDQKCVACGPRAGRARPDELTTDEALKLVEELAQLGVGEVDLIGGEAYLRADVLLVIRAIRQAGMKASMVTGGLNLTRARADALVEAGLQFVSVSIDGLEASHDALRGTPGGWRRAFAALRHAQAAGISTGANSQINAKSRHDLPALAELLADAGVRAWQMFLTMPHGNAADHPELLLQPYDLLEVFAMLDEMIPRARARGIRIWPGNNLGYFGPVEHELRQSQNQGAHYRGCQAGLTGIGIEADGAIKSCPSLGGPTNTGGSWREHGLRALWEGAEPMRYVERRTLDDLWGYCRECYYASTCMAGCTATSEPLLGRPGNNPYCHHRALELDRMGLRERVEQVAAAGPEAFAHGLFRLIREHTDPALRAAGPVQIDEPRTGRDRDPSGPGHTIELGVSEDGLEGMAT